MAQNIRIAGATYNDVPAVAIPTPGGSIATFYDVSGNQAITANGTYNIASKETVSVNVESDAFVLEYQMNGNIIQFISNYATTKAAVLANKTFRYSCSGNDKIGGWFGSCYATNQIFHGVAFTECLRFWIETGTDELSLVFYGYSNGVLTQASELRLYRPSGSVTLTENGTYDVSAKASAVVSIPVYDGSVV